MLQLPLYEAVAGDVAASDPDTGCAPDPSVLCFVQWTDNLTSQFQENQNGMNYQHLVVSQFLGSNSGILRFFPGGLVGVDTGW